jgi:7,8-dihydropterin-6-yl-methyl-4-(beta-D-ribofuranosyl)aminobenzene 5'-phosphate synthase
MKAIHILLLAITPCILGACAAQDTAPAQTSSPVEALHVADTAPAEDSGLTIPVTQTPITPALTITQVRDTETPEILPESPAPVSHSLTITIIYDNNAFDPRLGSAWGFSALVENRDHTLLFDTGGDGQLLMQNMHILGIDPTQIDSVMLSHAHDDHTVGLTALLNTGIKPTVYLLPSFPPAFKHQIEQFTSVSEVSPGDAIAEGFWSTGELETAIPEQALVLQTGQGLVIITGCAHPGIVEIVEQVRDMFSEPVHLVLGGFHLGNKSEAEINAILMDFRRLGVMQVAPTHCTGELAISRFVAEYGEDFIQVGVGGVITMGK